MADADAPRLPFRALAKRIDGAATEADEGVLDMMLLENRAQAVDGVAFRDRAEVEAHAGLGEARARRALVEFELLSYARGRTFDDAFIILDEAENLSKREALLLIGRMGEGNTKIAMLGDHVQCDRKDLKSYNDCGLVHAKECLKGLSEVSVDEFDNSDIVRNSFITKVFDNW